MELSTVALIVTLVTIVLFLTNVFDVWVTSMIGGILMVICGVIPASDAFSSFGGDIAMLMIGIMIMGTACTVTGIAERIGYWTIKISGGSERKMIGVLFVVSCVASMFLNVTVIVAVFTPILCGVVSAGKGKFDPRHLFLPMGAGGGIGGILSLVGSSNILNASNQLVAFGYERGFTFFEPTKTSVLGIVLCCLFVPTIGYNFYCKYFEKRPYPDLAIFGNIEGAPDDYKSVPKWKVYVAAGTLIGAAIMFAWNPLPHITTGTWSMIGGMIVILTGIVTGDQANKGISWPGIWIIAGTAGVSAGISSSGAGEIVSDFVIGLFPFAENSPFAMCVIFMLLTSLLSNFMSDNGAVGITVPVAMSVATGLGVDPLPFALACSYGSTVAVATPCCKPPLATLMFVGYSFKDFVAVGLPINLIMLASGSVMFKILYFM